MERAPSQGLVAVVRVGQRGKHRWWGRRGVEELAAAGQLGLAAAVAEQPIVGYGDDLDQILIQTPSNLILLVRPGAQGKRPVIWRSLRRLCEWLTPNTVHFVIRIAADRSIRVVGCGVRGRNG